MNSLAIVVLAFNEVSSLEETIVGLRRVFTNHQVQIIISTSRNATSECKNMSLSLSKNFENVSVYFQIEPFVAAAVLEASELVYADYLIYMSADGETPYEAAIRLLDKIVETQADVVSSSRWLPGATFENYGWFKLLLSRFAQNLCRVLYFSNLTEFTYGYRIYRREIFQTCKFKEKKHPFFLETLLIPLKLGLQIEEIAVSWSARKESTSMVDFRTILSYIRPIFRVKLSAKGKLLK